MNRRALRTPITTILTVCTGNICRSPFAEGILKLRLQEEPRFEIASAGLHAVTGAQMDQEAALQLIAHGGNPAGLIGKPLNEGLVKAADLILTMTRSQRDEVIRRFPSAMHRTFTLAEFARLLEIGRSNSDNPESKIRRASLQRGQILVRSEDDVVDPINASPEVHKLVAQQIVSYVDKILSKLVEHFGTIK
ncbi:arsenate reductase/protein-tyrosine-phosphatase family protein [Glutamicibacter arilaitensis]|uniref:arsenate reductase/protein-tyrosine-phosphatase family protein n=1 Tax=Glutamicibacter arilaitensis TaxID=256701 RepID=UPI003FD61E3F